MDASARLTEEHRAVITALTPPQHTPPVLQSGHGHLDYCGFFLLLIFSAKQKTRKHRRQVAGVKYAHNGGLCPAQQAELWFINAQGDVDP